jgi:hypothetical protein
MSTSIKINRVKLIQTLKDSLQKAIEGQYHSKKLQEKEIARFKNDVQKWEKDMEAWRKSFRDLAHKDAYDVALDITDYDGSRYSRYYICRVEYKIKNKVTGKVMKIEQRCNVDFEDAPKEPIKWDYKTDYEDNNARKVEEIGKLIKALELSDQEKVSTSVYRSVIKYL